jgi:hypothetical protein
MDRQLLRHSRLPAGRQAKAGIQGEEVGCLDARLRGHDGSGCIKIMLTEY